MVASVVLRVTDPSAVTSTFCDSVPSAMVTSCVVEVATGRYRLLTTNVSNPSFFTVKA